MAHCPTHVTIFPECLSRFSSHIEESFLNMSSDVIQLIWLIPCDLWRFVVTWSRTVFAKWHLKWLRKRHQPCYTVHRWLYDFKPPLYLVDFIHEQIQNTWVFSHVCLDTFCSHPSRKLYFKCCFLSWVFVNVVFYPGYSWMLFSILGFCECCFLSWVFVNVVF